MMDTTPEAMSVQTKVLRNLTGPQRLMIALEMSLAARELSSARLLLEHPNWSQAQVKRELLRYAFGSAALPEPLR